MALWGLDPHEIHWSKFKTSSIFSRVYHLRRTKMITYQLAMIFCVCSEAVGTAALADYLDQQTALESHQSYPQPQPQPQPQPDTTATTAAQIKVHNNDFIGSAAYNIVAGVTVATIFGAAFFFDLFWPERHEDTGVRRAWCACAMLACAMMGSSAVVMTVVTAGHRARISASSPAGDAWTGPGPGPQLVYRLNPKAVAAVVLAWPGAVFTLISTIVLVVSKRRDERVGPRSRTGRLEKDGV